MQVTNLALCQTQTGDAQVMNEQERRKLIADELNSSFRDVERIVSDTVVVGNCPTCNAFPVQHIATDDGGTEHRFLKKEKNGRYTQAERSKNKKRRLRSQAAFRVMV